MIYKKDKSKPRYILRLMLLPFFSAAVLLYILGAIWFSQAVSSDSWVGFIILMALSMALSALSLIGGIVFYFLKRKQVKLNDDAILKVKYDYTNPPEVLKHNYLSEKGCFFSFRKEGLRIIDSQTHIPYLANYANVKFEVIRLHPLTKEHPVAFLKVSLSEYETVLLNKEFGKDSRNSINATIKFEDLIDFSAELYERLKTNEIKPENQAIIHEAKEPHTLTDKKIKYHQRAIPLLKAVGIIALYALLVTNVVVFADYAVGILIGIPFGVITFFISWDLILNQRVLFAKEGYSYNPYFYVPYSDISKATIKDKKLFIKNSHFENDFIASKSIINELKKHIDPSLISTDANLADIKDINKEFKKSEKLEKSKSATASKEKISADKIKKPVGLEKSPPLAKAVKETPAKLSNDPLDEIETIELEIPLMPVRKELHSLDDDEDAE